MAKLWQLVLVSVMLAIRSKNCFVNAYMDLGVNYGTLGDNLPPATNVIDLYKRYEIGMLRLFDPNPDLLNALRGVPIGVVVGVRNEDIPAIASSPEAANSWFQTNLQPYAKDVLIQLVTVGNEVIPGVYAEYVFPAVRNLQAIADAARLEAMKVTTVLSSQSLAASYPPSQGAFTPEASSALSSILPFISTNGSPLLVNTYPYFAYAADPEHVSLDYALFAATSPVVQDGNLSYYNLYDAMLDAFFSAAEKLGVKDLDMVVSESGWPSAGNGNFTTPELASTYNKNLVQHALAKTGTPKRPDAYIQAFIFRLFNENQKPPGIEQNWGLCDPNMEPVYPVFN